MPRCSLPVSGKRSTVLDDGLGMRGALVRALKGCVSSQPRVWYRQRRQTRRGRPESLAEIQSCPVRAPQTCC